MTDKMQQSFADGKYTVIYEGGKVTALRYGEPWQDLTGNNLVYWMLVEVDKLRGNPPAPTAQPAAEDRLRMALRADLATESLAVDDLLRAMGEGPEQYRTDGGAVNRPRLLAWLKDRAAQPVQQPGAEPIGWQYRWTNPGNDPMVHQQDIDWKPVASRAPAQTIEQRIDELRSYKYTDGKPCYEVRAIYTQAAPAQRQPLTSFELRELCREFKGNWQRVLREHWDVAVEFAEAIEAAHGITAAGAAQKGEKL